MDKISEIDKQIKLLEEEKGRLLAQKKEEDLAHNWAEIQERVRNISDDEIFCAGLYSDTKTIPLFDEFYWQDKPFLKLGFMGYSYCYISSKYSMFGNMACRGNARVSLILIKSWKAIRRNSRILTASELKKYNHDIKAARQSSLTEIRELVKMIDGRIKDEFKELLLEHNAFIETYYPLSKPISIGAQILKNREGYGNIYNGETLVHEGTKYGETTEFLIVGICVDTVLLDDEARVIEIEGEWFNL